MPHRQVLLTHPDEDFVRKSSVIAASNDCEVLALSMDSIKKFLVSGLQV
jgi:hypothetical protein